MPEGAGELWTRNISLRGNSDGHDLDRLQSLGLFFSWQVAEPIVPSGAYIVHKFWDGFAVANSSKFLTILGKYDSPEWDDILTASNLQ